jgi:hypothetical protein
MSERDGATEEYHEPGLYEFRLKGHLDERWAERFEGLTFSYESDGTTVLFGQVVDQAPLYGLLRTVRDLGLPLLSVAHIGPEQTNLPDVQPGHGSQPSATETTP